ncbi:MAG: hypothetical protein V4689_19105 [Verrucomicrobiota bacterium]
MIRTISLLTSVLLVGILSAEQPAPASEEASSKIRRAMTEATRVNVYEGLPHQMSERDLLATESKRKDTEKIGSFRFYTPPVAATNPEVLKRILWSSDTIRIFGGEKRCGGFHPDYAVQWSSEDGSRFFAQICFGCHEIIYSDGKNQYRYNLEKEAFEQLKKELAPYAKKRPKTNG